MSEHTPEPWELSSESPKIIVVPSMFEGPELRTLIGSTCGHPNSWAYPTEEAGAANALRIISCVNACAGMEDPEREIAELRKQRDVLLSAVTSVQSWWEDHKYDVCGDYGDYNVYDETPEHVLQAEQAIKLALGDGP